MTLAKNAHLERGGNVLLHGAHQQRRQLHHRSPREAIRVSAQAVKVRHTGMSLSPSDTLDVVRLIRVNVSHLSPALRLPCVPTRWDNARYDSRVSDHRYSENSAWPGKTPLLAPCRYRRGVRLCRQYTSAEKVPGYRLWHRQRDIGLRRQQELLTTDAGAGGPLPHRAVALGRGRHSDRAAR